MPTASQLLHLTVVIPVFAARIAFGWGAPHGPITRAALDALPPWQREALGAEREPLERLYCIIPDLVFTRQDLAPYAMMDSRPGVVYLTGLHLPGTAPENLEILRSFLGRAVAALQTNGVAEAARYGGTLAHLLEDWSCPAHSAPRDNMFTLFKQFLPPPESHRYALLHGPVENGNFSVNLAGYRPQLLGTTVDEAAFHLLRRSQEGTVFARGQVVPILRALYCGDTNGCDVAQEKAAQVGARLTADALYTLLCLGTRRIDPAEATPPAFADLSAFAPLEAPDLYLPQTAFFSKPHWGHATVGVCLKAGQEPVPLRLLMAQGGSDGVRTFERGVGTGTRSTLSYLLPPHVYARFTATVGLHAELGAAGHVTFSVLGNGLPLAGATLRGGDPAVCLDVPVGGVTNLQLTVTSAGGDGSGNYAVWAEPRAIKAP